MKQRPTGVFVLIDALGWELAGARDFLQELLPYRQPVQTVLGFSSGAIPSLLTGLQPAHTGHWNLWYYDPAGSPFRWLRPLSVLPEPVINSRITRKLLKELGRRWLGLGTNFECHVSPRVLPWFNFLEKQSIYKPGGISGTTSIFDQLASSGETYSVYTYHDGRDSQLVNRAVGDLRQRKCRFLFLYLSELDAFLHEHCDDAVALQQKLNDYARNLEWLFRNALLVDPDANIAVFSDHGMTPVEHHFDLVNEIKRLGWRVPRDYLVVYDSTMARFWFFQEKARYSITNRLRELSCGRILDDVELNQLGILFPDRRYGELIFLLKPGWLLNRSDFHGGGWMPRGMHGYDPSDPFSYALFLSNKEPRVPVNQLTDVYQVLHAAVAE